MSCPTRAVKLACVGIIIALASAACGGAAGSKALRVIKDDPLASESVAGTSLINRSEKKGGGTFFKATGEQPTLSLNFLPVDGRGANLLQAFADRARGAGWEVGPLTDGSFAATRVRDGYRLSARVSERDPGGPAGAAIGAPSDAWTVLVRISAGRMN